MAAPAKLLTMSQGFQDPKGGAVASGSLMLTLSQSCTVTATGGIVDTVPIYLPLDVNGKITNTALWFQDELSPSGTVYRGVVYGKNGLSIISGLDQLSYSFTGAGPFDLSTAVQSATASPNYSGAVLLAPTGNQSITNDLLPIVTSTQNLGSASKLWNGFFNTLNKVTITQPATGATLTIQDGTTVKGPASVPNGALIAFGVPKFQQFTASGTFTIPAGVTGVKVTAIGGGGAGGGATASAVGGGGASGGCGIKYLSGLTPGNTLTVTIGAAGTGVNAGTGNAGGTTTVASGTQVITSIVANGGGGGIPVAGVGTGGAGAVPGTGGDFNLGGTAGAHAYATALGGDGGASFLGGGAQGLGNATGNAAGAPGAGGGGSGIGGNNTGGAGGAGIVIFEWVT